MPRKAGLPPLLGKRIAQIHMTDLRAIDRRMAPLGLRRSTFICLALLYDRDGRRPGEFSADLGVNRSTITRAIERLVALGYVRSEEDPDDRRACRIWLEPAARAARPRILRILRENDRTMLDGMTASDRRTLLRLLDQVLKNTRRFLSTLKDNSPEEP